MKIKINTAHESGRTFVTEVEEVKMPKKYNLRFFFHDATEIGYKYKYTITEYSSGCVVSYGNTEKECIDLLKIRLKKVGEQYIIEQGKKLVKSMGLKYPVNK